MNEVKYKKLRKSVTSEILRAKRSSYDNKVKNVKSSNDIFGCFNHLCGKKRKKNTEVDVEKINEFFVKIGKQVASKCSPVNSIIKSDNDGLDQTFVLFSTDAKEVFNIISNLKNKSSCGHDGISNKILKLAASSISAF